MAIQAPFHQAANCGPFELKFRICIPANGAALRQLKAAKGIVYIVY
jgi:hypothetical protein